MFFQDLYHSFYDYFMSLYVNTSLQLLILLAIILVFIFTRRIFYSITIYKLRNNTQMVVGAWGTRGKSSIERLKTAIFYGLGFNVMSKTSGSEPNITYGSYLNRLHEIVLYRPYDGSSIKEQIAVARQIIAVKPQVFLWECFAVTPRYAKILQEWMQDDITTISNTYPDHENVQGPRGIDVAESLGACIPKNATLLTAEDSMLPVLDLQCKENNTRLLAVTWQDRSLITKDTFDAIPFDIYGKNLSLILEFGKQLNLNQNECLQYISRHFVPDIGAFRVFDTVEIDQRRLKLINCMAANDIYSANISLKAFDYESFTIKNKPEDWIIVGINNRYDRVERSHAFSTFVTNTVQADKYIIMGSSTTALMSTIKDDWNAKLKTIFKNTRLDEGNQDSKKDINHNYGSNLQEIINSIAEWNRVCPNSIMFSNRFRDSITQLTNSPLSEDNLDEIMANLDKIPSSSVVYHEDLIELIKQQYQNMLEYQKLIKDIERNSFNKKTISAIKKILTGWYLGKFSIIKNLHASGDEINLLIIKNTPLQLTSNLLFISNIKGPGVALCYSWLLWTKCEKICRESNTSDENVKILGLQFLAKQPFFNILSIPYISNYLSELNKQSIDDKATQALITTITAILKRSTPQYGQGKKSKSIVVLRFLLQLAEDLLEPGDSIRRKRKADMIYQQLAKHLISHNEAEIQLNRLIIRQRGGWLTKIFIKN